MVGTARSEASFSVRVPRDPHHIDFDLAFQGFLETRRVGVALWWLKRGCTHLHSYYMMFPWFQMVSDGTSPKRLFIVYMDLHLSKTSWGLRHL